MYQICVSGAHNGVSVDEGRELAQELGKALAQAGHSLLTGGTIGLPNITALAYKAAGGKMSVGISPATSKIEHVHKYRLPTEAYDTILYTGLHYVGRDVLLISSSDAVFSIGGRMGTVHELAIAIETETPIGFLQGTGGISSEITDILHAAGESRNRNVIFSDKPIELVAKMVALLDKEHKKYLGLYR